MAPYRPWGLLVAVALLVVVSGSLALVPSAQGSFDGRAGPVPAPVGDGRGPLPAASAVPETVSGAPVSVSVGGSPVGVAVDPANDSAFVACQFDQTLYAISLSTDQVVATYPLGSFTATQGVVFSPQNSSVFVANEGSNNVSVVSLPQASVLPSISVGTSPGAMAYDPSNKLVYVADEGSAEVTLISPQTDSVVATVPVQADPDAIAVDSTTHDVFVADAGTQNVSVISGVSNTVIATAFAGTQAGAYGAMAYDPADKDVYVANAGSNNVTVIGGANHTAFLSIPVGTGPSAVAVDAAKGEVFVANQFSDNVSVIATAEQAVVATIPVGNDPGTDGGFALDPTTGDLYVPNWGSNNVSIVSAATDTVVKTIAVGAGPVAVAVDPVSGAVFVANDGSANVTTFQTSVVTFDATGLPNGASWSVSTGVPPVTTSGLIAKGKGSITALVYSGKFSYAIGAPHGYAVATVTGKGSPSQTAALATSLPLVLTVKFGALENLTFTETGLVSGSLWGISLVSAVAHGGPSPQSSTTHGTSLTFTLVVGPWKYTVTPIPALYRASPSGGSVSVPSHASVRPIKFTVPTAKVTFHEFDLAKGTRWQVNLTGPVDLSASSTTTVITVSLENGTYTFTAWNFSSLHPHPASGTVDVLAPGPSITVNVTYTDEADPVVAPGAAPPLPGGEPPVFVALSPAVCPPRLPSE